MQFTPVLQRVRCPGCLQVGAAIESSKLHATHQETANLNAAQTEQAKIEEEAPGPKMP